MPSSSASLPVPRRGLIPRRGWAAMACGLALAVAGLTSGCAARAASAGPDISLSTAQISLPGPSGITDVYVDVQNAGPADELIGARISVGGHVALRSPAGTGAAVMRTVPSIAIPARSSVGLDPNGPHLLVTHAGKMISGHEITVTLLFAHAGAISVPAMVTDPANGGASYFLN